MYVLFALVFFSRVLHTLAASYAKLQFNSLSFPTLTAKKEKEPMFYIHEWEHDDETGGIVCGPSWSE